MGSLYEFIREHSSMGSFYEFIRRQSNVRRILALTAIGCGVYVSKELYVMWRKESKTERKRKNGHLRHSAYDSYPDLSIHNNMMARHLTADVYEALKNKKTSGGFTLEKVIQIGVDCPGTPWERASGVIAGDEESYQVFSLLFDKIIADLHQHDPENTHVKNMDIDDMIKDMLDGKRVKSMRIKGFRSLKGYRLPAACSRQERREIEHAIRLALSRLQGEFKGEYFSICDLPENYKKRLATRMLLPEPTVPLITYSGRARDWPDARGIFVSSDKSFIVIVNEADHLQVVLLSKESDLVAAFEKFTRGLTSLEKELNRNREEYSWNDHLGYIVSDPMCLGTGLDVHIRVRLRLLSVDNRLHFILKSLNLKRSRKGIPSVDIHRGDFYVCSLKTLGVTEVEIINNLIKGVNKLIHLESLLENGEDIDGTAIHGTSSDTNQATLNNKQ